MSWPSNKGNSSTNCRCTDIKFWISILTCIDKNWGGPNFPVSPV